MSTTLLVGQLFGTNLSNATEFFNFPPQIDLVSTEFKGTNRNTVWLDFFSPAHAEMGRVHIKETFPALLVKFARPLKKTIERQEECFVETTTVWPAGLQILEEWVSEEQEAELVKEIDAHVWECGIKRRVQHYGFVFQYSTLKATVSADQGFPPLCQLVSDQLATAEHQFDQLTINEYVPGVGIGSHCDTHSAFSESIPVVSLLSDIVMDFVFHDGSKRISINIPRRSLMVLGGEARYGWRHAIASRRTDATPRGRRISLTFRKCISSNCTCPYPLLCDSQGADMTRPRRLVNG